MNRFNRVIAILIQLQSKRVVTAAEIAERFNISLRTVYRDIRSLEEAGVPIIGEAGIGYSIVRGYNLPPVVFDQPEALALLTAEKLVANFTDHKTSSALSSAMFKLKSTLGNKEKELLDDLNEHLIVIQNKYLPQDRHENLPIFEILDCINAKRVLQISYLSNAESTVSTRDIEPIGLYTQGEYWYLTAFCRWKNDYRNFRLDRVKAYSFLKEKFVTVHPALVTFLERQNAEQPVFSIRLEMHHSTFKKLGNQHYYMGFQAVRQLEKDYVELDFLSYSLQGFARWFLMFAEKATIVYPEELKKEVRSIYQRIGDLDWIKKDI